LKVRSQPTQGKIYGGDNSHEAETTKGELEMLRREFIGELRTIKEDLKTSMVQSVNNNQLIA
jgi:hypothetical protein